MRDRCTHLLFAGTRCSVAEHGAAGAGLDGRRLRTEAFPKRSVGRYEARWRLPARWRCCRPVVGCRRV